VGFLRDAPIRQVTRLLHSVRLVVRLAELVQVFQLDVLRHYVMLLAADGAWRARCIRLLRSLRDRVFLIGALSAHSVVAQLGSDARFRLYNVEYLCHWRIQIVVATNAMTLPVIRVR